MAPPGLDFSVWAFKNKTNMTPNSSQHHRKIDPQSIHEWLPKAAPTKNARKIRNPCPIGLPTGTRTPTKVHSKVANVAQKAAPDGSECSPWCARIQSLMLQNAAPDGKKPLIARMRPLMARARMEGYILVHRGHILTHQGLHSDPS